MIKTLDENLSTEAIQLPFGMYIKKFVAFRLSEFISKFVTLDDSFMFPRNTAFHFTDAMIDEVENDIPNIDNYPYFKSKMPRKRIFHNKVFPTEGDFKVEKRYRFFLQGMNKNILDFNRKNRSLMIPIQNYQDPESEMVMQLINHNPLTRVKLMGIMKHYDKFEIMMSSVFDTIKKNSHRNNFIPIRISDNLFRSQFMSIVQSGRIMPATLRHNSMYYYFVLHVILFLLDNNNKLSLLSKFSKEELSSINFIFYNSKTPPTGIIYNLQYLASLCDSQVRVWRFLTGLNALFYNVSNEADLEIVDKNTQESDVVTPTPAAAPAVTATTTTSVAADTVVDKTPTIVDIKKEIKETEDKIKSEEIVKEMQEEEPHNFEALIQKKTVQKINKEAGITPAQKTAAVNDIHKYKTIPVTVNGKETTIGEVIKTPPKVEIKTSVISEDLQKSLFDKSMASTTLKEFDSVYMKEYFYPDLFQTFLTFQQNGLLLSDYKETNVDNEINRVKHIKVTLQSINRKRHTLNLKVPIPDEDGFFMINGVKTIMSKQLVNVPICKISPTRVNLVSSFNKTMVDRKSGAANSYETIVGKQIIEDPNIEFEYSTVNIYKETKIGYEYSSLGSRFGMVANSEYEILFDQGTILKDLKLTEDAIKGFSSYGSVIGRSKKSKDVFVFIALDNKISIVNIKKKEVLNSGNEMYLADLLFGADAEKIKISTEFCQLKILDKDIPIAFILGYQFGMKNILDYMKVKYYIVNNEDKFKPGKNELAIKFLDKTLVYNKYPIKHSLILNGLLKYPTLNRYPINELNSQDIYYQLMADKGMSTNYLIGISNYFDFFIDHITRDILMEMKEPTNTRDLLIRAVELLSTEDYKDASASENLRIRSFEKINSIIYNEISRQYANYSSKQFKEKSFSINTEAIFQRIVQDQTVILAEDINPIHSMKEYERVTYSGFGGRSAESFVEKDRAYSKTNLGVLSECTPDSGSVGINRFLTGDPGIKNGRGLLRSGNTDAPTKLLNSTTLLMPFSVNDDPKRANFINIQLSHHVPSENAIPLRVRTGYETTIANRTSSSFSYTAKNDGEIVDVNDELKLVKIRYKDKTEDVFSYKSDIGTVSGSYLKKEYSLTDKVKKGKKVKAGDVLCYHKGFFKEEDGKINWCHGIPAKVGIIEKDTTIDDSTSISREISRKFLFNSIYLKDIEVTTDMVIKKVVKVGDTIKFDDELCVLEYPDIEMLNIKDLDPDIESDDIMLEMKSIKTKSKHEGTIFDIQVFYVDELKDMSPSIAAFIRKIEKEKIQKAAYSHGTDKENRFKPSGKLEPGTRIKGRVINNGSVLICFYIDHVTSCGVGDKLVLDSSLKTIIGEVVNETYMSKSGIKVDCLTSGTGIYNRIIMSPIKVGLVSGCIEKIENDIVDMWFN